MWVREVLRLLWKVVYDGPGLRRAARSLRERAVPTATAISVAERSNLFSLFVWRRRVRAFARRPNLIVGRTRKRKQPSDRTERRRGAGASHRHNWHLIAASATAARGAGPDAGADMVGVGRAS